MKKLILLSSLLMFSYLLNAQYLISYQQLHSYNQADVTTYLTNQGIPVIFVPVTNGMDIYKITYQTVSYDNTPTIASGTVFVPTGVSCKVPLLSYNHGTTLSRFDAPSNETGEYLVGVALGADGYVISMPDYLGLGDSPGLHPYHHANSEATCTIDMLRATYDLLDSLSFGYNDEVFLTGYSQGGHVALATLKYIEEHNMLNELNVGGTAPLSGAYDLAGVQADVITKDSTYDAPGYLPFMIFAYNMVYNLYSDYSEIFVSPYDTILPPLMTGNNSLGPVEAVIPDTPHLILQPLLLDSFENHPNFTFKQLLLANSLYAWAPQTPVRMIYCESDNLVNFHNALVARDSMVARGAPTISTLSAANNQNHQDCALYALLQAKNYFEGLRKDRFDLSLVTTSASGGSASDGSIQVNISQGYPPFTYLWNDNQTTNPAVNLPNGNYSVTVTDANGCTASASGIVGVTGLEDQADENHISVFPNPANHSFTVQAYKPFSEGSKISLTDLSGRTVLTSYISSSTSQVIISLDGVAAGMYTIVIDGKDQSLIGKLMVE